MIFPPKQKLFTMENSSDNRLYNSYMSVPKPYTKRFRQLRWKLTLSYTGVTVGALLTVELILLALAALGLNMVLNSGALQADLIQSVSEDYTPQLQFLLSNTPPNQEEIASWLERTGNAVEPRIPLTFNASDQLFIVGQDETLLASRPTDYFGKSAIGRTINMQALPGLAAPLQAALAGDEQIDNLYNLPGADESVIMAIPIWDEAHQQVLGAMVAVGELPTVQSVFNSIVPIMGISLLILALVAGVAGTIYGSVAARGLTSRLDNLSAGAQAWRQGDFTKQVADPSADEIGQLASNLNQMAGQLQQLMETRQELIVVDERNRLARELHDSAKQQAFAAAAQISAAKNLIPIDPDATEIRIADAEKLIDALRKELTTLIQELRPTTLANKDFISAVRAYAEDWSRQNEIELLVNSQHARPLPMNVEQMMFRIIQEALANIARHSQANKAEINLIFTKQDVTCTIKDYGIGFNPDNKSNGFGIRSMQERANALSSRLNLESAPGEGTQISFTINIEKSSKKDGDGIHE